MTTNSWGLAVKGRVLDSAASPDRARALIHIPKTPDAQIAEEMERDEVARQRAARLICRLASDEEARQELLEACDLAPYKRGKRQHGNRARA